jgi:hypothetical protein
VQTKKVSFASTVPGPEPVAAMGTSNRGSGYFTASDFFRTESPP